MSMRRVPTAILVAGALGALLAWSCWTRWQLVSISPFPLGVDGYFYPIELRALLDHGRLAYPSSPLAFYLLAPFAAVTDPITGAKLGAAVLCALIALPAYGVGARLGGSRGAGLVAAALATTSEGSAYLTVEFVKNGIGLTVALAGLWAVLRAAERPSRARITVAIGGMVAAYATHKMAAALVLVVALPIALAAAADHGRLRGRRLIYATLLTVVALAAVLVAGAVMPRRLLSIEDAGLIRGLISPTLHWLAPALTRNGNALALGYDALLGLGLAAAAIATRMLATRQIARRPTDRLVVRPPSAVTAASAAILILAIVIGLPFLAVDDAQGLGFRLRLAAFVPCALAAAILARAVHHRYKEVALVALAVVLVLVRRPGPRLDGEVITHPALVTASLALAGRVPPGATLIVPERHIAFMVAWYTGAAVALRPDRVPPARRYRLLPRHFIGDSSALDRLLLDARAEPGLVAPLGVHPRHPNGLVLVTEPTWDWLLARLPPADRAYFEAWPTI